MSYNPGSGGSGKIATDGDVALSNPADNQVIIYKSGVAKWENSSLTGLAALPKSGGAETVVSNAAATGAVTLDLAQGNVFDLTLTGNVTLTFTGAISGTACSFGLYLTQGGGGNFTAAWPTAVKWAGATVPTLSTAAGAVDILVFETIDGGTTWYGSLVGVNFA